MDSFKGSPCASAVGEKMEIRRVMTERKILMCFSPNRHTPIMSTYAHTHTYYIYIYIYKYIHIYFFAPLPNSIPSNIWTSNVKSAANYLQGNYSTAGDEEPALLPQYRGLFSRSPPNQHTDYSSDWDQKKPVFDTSLLVLALPNWPSPPAAPHLRPHQLTAHLMGLANSRNRAVSLRIFHLPPPLPLIRCIQRVQRYASAFMCCVQWIYLVFCTVSLSKSSSASNIWSVSSWFHLWLNLKAVTIAEDERSNLRQSGVSCFYPLMWLSRIIFWGFF